MPMRAPRMNDEKQKGKKPNRTIGRSIKFVHVPLTHFLIFHKISENRTHFFFFFSQSVCFSAVPIAVSSYIFYLIYTRYDLNLMKNRKLSFLSIFLLLRLRLLLLQWKSRSKKISSQNPDEKKDGKEKRTKNCFAFRYSKIITQLNASSVFVPYQFMLRNCSHYLSFSHGLVCIQKGSFIGFAVFKHYTQSEELS